MYVVPIERHWKDDTNPTKYSKSPKIDLQGFRNKVMTDIWFKHCTNVGSDNNMSGI
mgnify:CR=1 FL=1